MIHFFDFRPECVVLSYGPVYLGYMPCGHFCFGAIGNNCCDCKGWTVHRCHVCQKGDA